MAKSSLDWTIQISPETAGILDVVCANVKLATRLLEENKKLLSRTIDGSFEVVKAPHHRDRLTQVDASEASEEMERFSWDLAKKIQERVQKGPKLDL